MMREKIALKDRIAEICKDLENKHNIQILFAVENGSRAWRMESKDSDYDVRFVFHYPLNEYLKLNQPKDVIEAYFDGEGKSLSSSKGALIDIVGFDLFKFAKLLSSSNPTTIEWLISDIIYYGKQNQIFQSFALNESNPLSLYHHYKSMCKYNYTTYILSNKNVTYKKYLYSFRGLINAKWVAHKKSIPPMNFHDALKSMEKIISPVVLKELHRIVKIKSQGKEKQSIPRIELLDKYVEHFLSDNSEAPASRKSKGIDKLNQEIKNILNH